MSLYLLNETKRVLFQSCKGGSLATVQQLLTQHFDLRTHINSLTDDDGNPALMIASENGHTGIVKLLLQCGANVDHKNSRGWTALMKASENGDCKLEIIDLLLAYDAQVDLQSNEGYTALMVAAQNSQVKVATKLVREYGAIVGLKQKHSSRTALMEASESGSIDIVKLLIEYGADDLGWALVLAILNKQYDIIELLLGHGAQMDDETYSSDEPPLVVAVEKGDTDVVKLLLQHGANVNQKNSHGWTALMKASKKGDSKLEIIELLLKHGAQVDPQNDDGKSALMVAAQNSQAKLATKLVREYGASVGLKQKHSSWTALMEASESGSIDIVKLLLEHGADDLGWALVLAILNRDDDIVKLLLKHDAIINDDDWAYVFNKPPLIVAVEEGDMDMVKLLLEHGAKQGLDLAIKEAIFNMNAEIIQILSEQGAQVDKMDWSNHSPLVEAVEKGDIDVVKLLLKHGANNIIDEKTSDGWTVLMKASIKGDSKLEIIELLLKHGARVDLQNDDGESALMVAAQNGQAKLATKLVLEYGASVDLKKKHFSRTALMEASESGSIDIVKLLLEHGADDLGWALVLAILNKHSDIIELLLERGAQVDDKNWSLFLYQSPLVMAVETGDADIVKLLLLHGAKQGIEVIRIFSDQIDEMNLPDQLPLVEAVEKGDADLVKLLLEHGAKQGIYRAIADAIFRKNTDMIEILSKYGAQDWFDEPPLLEAVERGDADVVKVLLSHGADVDQKNSDGWTVLMKASKKGDSKLGIIELLLKHGAQVDLQNNDGESALMVAAQNGQAKLAAKLVREYGASADLKQKQTNRTALMEGSKSGSIDIVKLLLEHGTDNLGWALVLAILHKHDDIIELLLKLGAQVDDKNWSLFLDQPPLVVAVEIGDADIVKLLLEHGAEQGIEWAMTKAIWSEWTEIVQMLLEYGVQVDDDLYKDGIVEEPELVAACKVGNINSVKLLLEYEAEETEYYGWALTEAILNQNAAVVDLLIEHGICIADDGDRHELDLLPAIVEASENGDSDSLKLLLKYGVKEQYQDYFGWALCMAATPEIVSLLLDDGAEADEMNPLCEIPLVQASSEGNIEAVKLMLNHGAKMLKYLPEALFKAIENCHTDMIEVLTQHGAHVDDESWFDLDKTPALVKASMQGNIETVKMLSKYGAEKNVDWALEAASKGGHTEIVNFLFDYGVEVDDCDMFDTAALVEASRNGKTDTVRFLLEQLGIMNRLGLALRAASGEGHIDIVQLLSEYGNADDLGYALIEASRSGHTKVIKFLIEYDVFIDFQEEQTTALIIAGGNGHTDSVKLLIECGAEVNMQNSHGISALMAASQANHTDVVELLQRYGANVNLKDNNGQTAAKLTNNDDVLSLITAASDNKFDTIEGEVDLHEDVQLTQEEKEHLIAIENAITETGTLDHTLVHGVFVGPPRSGKDSIMKRLLGQAASKISPSTGAVETAIHVKVEESCTYAATIGQSNWTRLEYDEEALHLMRTTSNNNSSANCTIEGEMFTDTQTADPPLAVNESTSDNFDNPYNKTVHLQTESTSESQSEIDSQSVVFQDETSFQKNKSEQTQQKRKRKTPIEIFKEAIKKKGLEGLRKLLTNSWSLYLTNTGGQMEFQELLPLLVSGPSMFFITFQLHKDVNECFQVEYELPNGESSKCYQSSLSILDSILQTLSTIAAMGTFVYNGLQKKCVPLKPKVFLIGTHKDLLDKNSAATIIDRIDAKLQEVIKSTSHYREGIIQFASKARMIFTVSNLDPSDSDFQTIRSAVEKTVEKGDYKMRSPTHWMIYSLVVRQLQNRIESYSECFAIAKECGIKDESEFNEALHFIHTKMGLVRYFPHEELKDIVVVDPQILFEKVTELIVETFTFENLPNHFKLEAFEHMGIFDLSDFTKISSRTGQKLTPTLFAKLLEYLRIAARFKQGGDTKYFLPCALTHAQVKQNVYNSTIPQLIATFQCGYCPKGLFGTLITYLINNEMQSDIEWELDTENIYRDEVCFRVGPYDTITIRFMPTHLQISCAESNPDLSRINCIQEDVCQEVRESVEKGIKKVTSAINYINAQHSFTFYCTSDVCSEDPHPSKLKEFKGKLCSVMCNKSKKCFRLPSGYEKWQLCSTEVCHDLKERLTKCHCSFLIQQLNSCAYKWREIGTYLKFQQDELNNIQANQSLINGTPKSWLSAMISDWMEWAPGDSRGSTSYANLHDLKSAVSKAGFGVVAEELSLSREVAAGESVQSTDTGRKRTSSSGAESSSKRPRLS